MRRALAALAVLALFGAACGNGDDTDANADADRGDGGERARDDAAAGIGDPYFPGLGNPGYDTDHYALDLAYDPATDVLDGTVVIDAHATDDLASFNLDLAGMGVSAVSVDDAEARFERDGDELVVTPTDELDDGADFTVDVSYSGVPEPAVLDQFGVEVGWRTTDDGSFTLSQPDGAHTWYPVNDHPSDKASYTFRLTVPEPYVAAANGVLTEELAGEGETTFVWEAPDPMASYLTQVAVGEFVIEDAGTAGDVVIRNVFASDLAEEASAAAARTLEMVEFYAEEWGPYPFDVYGMLVVDTELGLALETQTLSVFGADTCCFAGADVIQVHELAHQWFGDAVSPARWRDIWLSEGFATYAEWMWAEHADGVPIAESAAEAYDFLADDFDGPIGDPGTDGLFGDAVYVGGALTLAALRAEVGEETFDEIVRTYFERFDGESVTTDDFVAVAEEVSGEDLGDFFDDWLEATRLPPFPAAGEGNPREPAA
jgi:aminopeptidase N